MFFWVLISCLIRSPIAHISWVISSKSLSSPTCWNQVFTVGRPHSQAQTWRAHCLIDAYTFEYLGCLKMSTKLNPSPNSVLLEALQIVWCYFFFKSLSVNCITIYLAAKHTTRSFLTSLLFIRSLHFFLSSPTYNGSGHHYLFSGFQHHIWCPGSN